MKKHLLYRYKIVLIILGLVVLCGMSGGIYVFLQKYYFFNEQNVYVKRVVLERLNELYSQEFELLSIDFETIRVETGGAKYMHMWTFAFEDSQGRQFYVYDRISGSAKNVDVDGAFYHLDYYNKDYIDDTYGQLCMEDLTKMYFEETEFSNGSCLRCLINNEMGEKMFTYYRGTVTNKLQNQGLQISEQTVYDYFLQELQN